MGLFTYSTIQCILGLESTVKSSPLGLHKTYSFNFFLSLFSLNNKSHDINSTNITTFHKYQMVVKAQNKSLQG